MTLLLLSWAFPPMEFPRAVQVARLAKNLSIRPLKIVCLASDGDRVELNADMDSEFEVTRIPRCLPTRIAERMVPPMRRGILKNMDANWLWWRRAARHILIRKMVGRGDQLVTFGQPMADHRAGLRIKRATGVRWIAHFSDPWADNPFLPKAEYAKAARLEAEIVSAADKIIFTSAETVDLVMAKYPAQLRDKTAVVPHAFDQTLYPEVTRPTGPLILRYLGNLFAGRGPEPLFKALAILGQRAPDLLACLRVEIIGEIAGEMRRSVKLAGLPSELVRIIGRVPYSEALALMRSADLLLNIDAPGPLSVFLPSKLVDYIGAGRPIFGITPPGTARNLILELGGWVADPSDPAEIADALEKALNHIERHRNAPWGNPLVHERYGAAAVAAQFEQIIAADNTAAI